LTNQLFSEERSGNDDNKKASLLATHAY